MNSWTDERVEQMKALHEKGLSASQIAKALRGVSRNAVIGKLQRLGLLHRHASTPTLRAPTVKRSPHQNNGLSFRPAPAFSPECPPLPPEPDQPPGSATILTITASMCKWPIGTPGEPGFSLCGHDIEQAPYCAAHRKRAYQPAQAKKANAAELARSLRRYL